MNNNILFLVRADRVSILRYLLVTKELNKKSIKPIFLAIDPAAEKIIKKIRINLNLFSEIKHKDLSFHFYNYSNINYAFEDDFQSKNIKYIQENILKFFLHVYFFLLKLRNSSVYFFKNSKSEILELADDFFENKNTDDLEKYMKNFYLDSDLLIKNELIKGIKRYQNNTSVVESFLKKNDVNKIIFDLELHEFVRFFISSSKRNNIKVYSLQHGIGYCDAYSDFPVLADKYFAYSNYNKKIISNMGVDDEDIYLVGAPENSVLPNHRNIDVYRKSGRSKINIDANELVILIGLRPEKSINHALFKNYNELMIERLAKIYKDNFNVTFLLRPHPRDHGESNINVYNQLINDAGIRSICSDVDIQIEYEMAISDIFITFMSASIVSAVQIGLKTYVIKIDDDGDWPDWSKSDALKFIELENLDSLKTNNSSNIQEEQDNLSNTNSARNAFLEDYSTYLTDNSAERIASILLN